MTAETTGTDDEEWDEVVYEDPSTASLSRAHLCIPSKEVKVRPIHPPHLTIL